MKLVMNLEMNIVLSGLFNEEESLEILRIDQFVWEVEMNTIVLCPKNNDAYFSSKV
jgi:hypothetical protein